MNMPDQKQIRLNHPNITPEELEILTTTMKLWGQIVMLPKEHPDTLTELRTQIHTIQQHIASRCVFRWINENVIL